MARYIETSKPRLFAHRGASGEFPENTLEAFAAAVEAGVDILELDVHATADGEVVVLHDERLERTTDGSGLVRESTLDDLMSLDAGFRFETEIGDVPFRGRGIRVPRLSEVLERFPETALNIEIKQLEPPIEGNVIELLNRFGAHERVLLAAGDHRIIERIRQAGPDVMSGMSALEVADFLVRSATGELEDYRAPGFALQVPLSHGAVEVVTGHFIESAHEVGLEVHVWTINQQQQMDELLELGVDGLMSDYPSLLCERGQRFKQGSTAG